MSRELPGAVKGVVLGFCNTLLVAFCVGLAGTGGEAVFVVMFGFLPGVLTGAFLGHLAEALAHMNRKVLLGMMVLVSCLAVAALGDRFDARELVLVSCIPTAAACSVLERWTRKKPDEPLPLARVA